MGAADNQQRGHPLKILSARVGPEYDFSLPRQLYAAVRQACAPAPLCQPMPRFAQLLTEHMQSGQAVAVKLPDGNEAVLSAAELRCIFTDDAAGAEWARRIRAALPATLAVKLSEESEGRTGTVSEVRLG